MSFLRNKAGEVKLWWKLLLVFTSFVLLCIGTFFLVSCVIIPEIHYNMALDWAEEGDYDNAIHCFEFLDGYRDSEERILSIQYDIATSLLKKGEYQAAAQAFRALGNYKDSRKKASEILLSTQNEQLAEVQVGDILYFGHFEQDNHTDNGTEEIQWVVLTVQDDRALLLSLNALDARPYHNTFEEVTWEACSLRAWLNETFFQTAFEKEHQARILTSYVPSDVNPEYTTVTGQATEDAVFLLSLNEVQQYLIDTSWAACTVTPYAMNNQAYAATAQGECWWWCRTPGVTGLFASGVNPLGAISTRGNNVDYVHAAVRPAIWIRIGA